MIIAIISLSQNRQPSQERKGISVLKSVIKDSELNYCQKKNNLPMALATQKKKEQSAERLALN